MKIYELNCLIFASIVYHITVCSCAAVKTCVSCITCYISRRQVTRPYISPKQHFDNIEDFKVTEQTEVFQTIKDILLMILSKNNGILRIIKAKFDGEKRSNLQHTAEFAKWPR